MRTIAILSTVCLLPLLGGCTTADLIAEGTPAPHFGNAVRQDIAAQVTNPQAPTTGTEQSMNGERAAAAEDRYVSGSVEEPASVVTSSGTGGGAGGGGGTAGTGAAIGQ